MRKILGRTPSKQEALIKTARFVLDEKLDSAGFNPHGVEVAGEPEVSRDGDVTFTVVVTITALDIEIAQQEGK